ncbi:MAG: SAF domain-containing protein [Solirubrobacterales bacterium]
MSRRARAIAFAGMALVSAALAASLAGEYRDGVASQLGELREVVVVAERLRAGEPLRPVAARETLEVRRVPARFAPIDAIAHPSQAIGSAVRGPVPAGAYLTASLLRAPESRTRTASGPGPGREAVEIAVAGAGALMTTRNPAGRLFDVVATTEPSAGGPGGSTRVVAHGVELLALSEAAPAGDELGAPAGGVWTATLAASREDALRLIQAHNYAREVRLIGAEDASAG